MGKDFAFKTLLVSLLFPVLLELLQSRDVLTELGADPLISSLLAGGMLGLGRGLVLLGNGSCGDFDILLVPDINSGNILGKSWIIHQKSVMAGIIAGARIPIVLTSRGSTPEEKFYSLAVASVIASRE